MKPQAYAMLAARQQDHWWNRARCAMASALLRRFGLQQGCRWLDLGCGPGGNFAMLDVLRPALVTGVDLSAIALDFAQQHVPGAGLIRADITKGLPFASSAFDVVTIFNVLYHRWIPNETAVLGEVFRVLRPGGLVLITEPAFSVLKREMDEITMGRRRYRLDDIAALCTTVGLDTVFGSYFTSFGFPILMILKMANHLLKLRRNAATGEVAEMKMLPPAANEVLYQLACLESRLIVAGLRVPFGVTLLWLARRPPDRCHPGMQ
jgi:SAM-dependent methyltransferase